MNEHSKYYDRIKSYYPSLWSKDKVHDAVAKGLITPEEYEEIVGESYTGVERET